MIEQEIYSGLWWGTFIVAMVMIGEYVYEAYFKQGLL